MQKYELLPQADEASETHPNAEAQSPEKACKQRLVTDLLSNDKGVSSSALSSTLQSFRKYGRQLSPGVWRYRMEELNDWVSCGLLETLCAALSRSGGLNIAEFDEIQPIVSILLAHPNFHKPFLDVTLRISSSSSSSSASSASVPRPQRAKSPPLPTSSVNNNNSNSEGWTDAMLYTLALSVRHRGFLHAAAEAGLFNIVQDMYTRRCLLPRHTYRFTGQVHTDGWVDHDSVVESHPYLEHTTTPFPFIGPECVAQSPSLSCFDASISSSTHGQTQARNSSPFMLNPVRLTPVVATINLSQLPRAHAFDSTSSEPAYPSRVMLRMKQAAQKDWRTRLTVNVRSASISSPILSSPNLRSLRSGGGSGPSRGGGGGGGASTHRHSVALADLRQLANKIGQLYVTTDLTRLLAMKRKRDSVRYAMLAAPPDTPHTATTNLTATLSGVTTAAAVVATSSMVSGSPLQVGDTLVLQRQSSAVLSSQRRAHSSRHPATGRSAEIFQAQQVGTDRRSVATLRTHLLNTFGTQFSPQTDSPHRTRILLLYLMRHLSADHFARVSSRSPVNLLLHELETLLEYWPKPGAAATDRPLPNDEASMIQSSFGILLHLILGTLQNFSLLCDARYFTLWQDMPRRFPLLTFHPRQKKWDVFLWRWLAHLDCAIRGSPNTSASSLTGFALASSSTNSTLMTINTGTAYDWPLIVHILFVLAVYVRNCANTRRALCLHAAHLATEMIARTLELCQETDCGDVYSAKGIYYVLDIIDSFLMAHDKPLEVKDVFTRLLLDRTGRHYQWLVAYCRTIFLDESICGILSVNNSSIEQLIESDRSCFVLGVERGTSTPQQPGFATDRAPDTAATTGRTDAATIIPDDASGIGMGGGLGMNPESDTLFGWQEKLGLPHPPILLPHLFHLDRLRLRIVLHHHALLRLIADLDESLLLDRPAPLAHSSRVAMMSNRQHSPIPTGGGGGGGGGGNSSDSSPSTPQTASSSGTMGPHIGHTTSRTHATTSASSGALGASLLERATEREDAQRKTRVRQRRKELLQLFNPFVNPVDGELMVFLTNTPVEHHYAVKLEMLRFLLALLRFPRSPFVEMDSHLSAYMRYHYLTFIQLYSTDPSRGQHSPMSRMCELHLRILTAFALAKSEVIARKFYQLHVVPFLVRDIDLEWTFRDVRQQYLMVLEDQKQKKEEQRKLQQQQQYLKQTATPSGKPSSITPKHSPGSRSVSSRTPGSPLGSAGRQHSPLALGKAGIPFIPPIITAGAAPTTYGGQGVMRYLKGSDDDGLEHDGLLEEDDATNNRNGPSTLSSPDQIMQLSANRNPKVSPSASRQSIGGTGVVGILGGRSASPKRPSSSVGAPHSPPTLSPLGAILGDSILPVLPKTSQQSPPHTPSPPPQVSPAAKAHTSPPASPLPPPAPTVTSPPQPQSPSQLPTFPHPSASSSPTLMKAPFVPSLRLGASTISSSCYGVSMCVEEERAAAAPPMVNAFSMPNIPVSVPPPPPPQQTKPQRRPSSASVSSISAGKWSPKSDATALANASGGAPASSGASSGPASTVLQPLDTNKEKESSKPSSGSFSSSSSPNKPSDTTIIIPMVEAQAAAESLKDGEVGSVGGGISKSGSSARLGHPDTAESVDLSDSDGTLTERTEGVPDSNRKQSTATATPDNNKRAHPLVPTLAGSPKQSPQSSHPFGGVYVAPSVLKDDASFYLYQRSCYRVYMHTGVHLHFLLFLLSLLITPSNTLDPRYCCSFPSNIGRINILFLLHHHLNHPSNRGIAMLLYRHAVRAIPYCSGLVILIRLLCASLFDSSLYMERTKVGAGAYGTIWKCRLRAPFRDDGSRLAHQASAAGTAEDLGAIHGKRVQATGTKESSGPLIPSEFAVAKVAVKQIEVPKGLGDRCALFDLFNEVLILEKFRHEGGICRLYDYGVDHDFYYIVMKMYRCNLRQWRLNDRRPLYQQLPTYLSIFRKIVHTVCYIHMHGVCHFDIKCDNVLLDFAVDTTTTGGATANTPSHQTSAQLKQGLDKLEQGFTVILADFGESVVLPTDAQAASTFGFTSRGRGTECIRSPEMLLAFKNEGHRTRHGNMAKSDVWSLGCLLYELVTTEFLFLETSFMKFWSRVTSPTVSALEDEHRAKLGNSRVLLNLLSFILAKDPAQRPTVHELFHKLTAYTSADLQRACEELQQAHAAMMTVVSPNAAPPSVADRHRQAWLHSLSSGRVDRILGPTDAFTEILRRYVAPFALAVPTSSIGQLEPSKESAGFISSSSTSSSSSIPSTAPTSVLLRCSCTGPGVAPAVTLALPSTILPPNQQSQLRRASTSAITANTTTSFSESVPTSSSLSRLPYSSEVPYSSTTSARPSGAGIGWDPFLSVNNSLDGSNATAAALAAGWGAMIPDKFNELYAVLKNQLYLTNYTMAASPALLHGLGITHLVNVSVHSPPHPTNFTYLNLLLDMLLVANNPSASSTSNSSSGGTSTTTPSNRVRNSLMGRLMEKRSSNPSLDPLLEYKCTSQWVSTIKATSTAIRTGGRVLIYGCEGSDLPFVFAMVYLIVTYAIDSLDAYLWLTRQCAGTVPLHVVGLGHDVLGSMCANDQNVIRSLRLAGGGTPNLTQLSSRAQPNSLTHHGSSTSTTSSSLLTVPGLSNRSLLTGSSSPKGSKPLGLSMPSPLPAAPVTTYYRCICGQCAYTQMVPSAVSWDILLNGVPASLTNWLHAYMLDSMKQLQTLYSFPIYDGYGGAPSIHAVASTNHSRRYQTEEASSLSLNPTIGFFSTSTWHGRIYMTLATCPRESFAGFSTVGPVNPTNASSSSASTSGNPTVVAASPANSPSVSGDNQSGGNASPWTKHTTCAQHNPKKDSILALSMNNITSITPDDLEKLCAPVNCEVYSCAYCGFMTHLLVHLPVVQSPSALGPIVRSPPVPSGSGAGFSSPTAGSAAAAASGMGVVTLVPAIVMNTTLSSTGHTAASHTTADLRPFLFQHLTEPC